MKATELRIGNLIERGRIIKMDLSLCHYEYLLLEDANGNENSIIGEMGGINPIPLTEEWLGKFGLIQRSDMKQCFLFRCVDERVFCAYKDSTLVGWQIMIETNKTTGVWSVISKNIQYVHQLQNLIFALTGEELILKT